MEPHTKLIELRLTQLLNINISSKMLKLATIKISLIYSLHPYVPQCANLQQITGFVISVIILHRDIQGSQMQFKTICKSAHRNNLLRKYFISLQYPGREGKEIEHASYRDMVQIHARIPNPFLCTLNHKLIVFKVEVSQIPWPRFLFSASSTRISTFSGSPPSFV